MKRKLAALLSVIIAASLLSSCTGAGGNDQGNTSHTDSSITETTDQEQNENTSQPESTSLSGDESSDDSSASAESLSQSSSDQSSAVSSKTDNTSSANSQSSKNTSSQNSTAQSSQGSNNTAGSSAPSESSGNSGSTPADNTKRRPAENSSNSSQANSSTSKPANNSSTNNNTSNKPDSNSNSSKPSDKNNNNSGNNNTTKPQQSSTPSQQNSTPAQENSTPSPENTPTPVSTEIGDINTYNQLFDLSSKVTVSITMSKTEMDKLNKDYYTYKDKHSKSPIYRKCDLSITVGGKTYTIDEVGIRLKGNMSLEPVYDKKTGKLNLTHYKLSFTETFDDKTYYGSDAKKWTDEDKKARKNRRFATLKKLDLKWNRNFDDTYIREIYAAKMFRQSGVLAQNIGLTQIKFNNENYGVFSLYEPVDKTFLERYLPESALGGDLYKVGWTNSPANYVKNQVTYGVADEDKGKKYNFNLKTNEKKSKHESLKNLLSVINGNPTLSGLEKVIDTDYFCRFMAASYFAGDPDDIRNNYNNHYVYFRKDNGKAIFIVYDNDRTLGVTMGYNPDGTGMTGQSPYSDRAAGAGQNQANPMIKQITKTNGLLRNKYTAELKKVAALPLWNESEFEKEYNKAKNTYQSYITPSVKFANVKHTFRFSLDGKFTSSNKSNMSFHEYITRLMKTYRSYVK